MTDEGNDHAECDAKLAEQQREIDDLRAEVQYVWEVLEAERLVKPQSRARRRPKFRVVGKDTAPVVALMAAAEGTREYLRENKPAGFAIIAAAGLGVALTVWGISDDNTPPYSGPEPRPTFRTTAPSTRPASPVPTQPTSTRTATPSTTPTAARTPVDRSSSPARTSAPTATITQSRSPFPTGTMTTSPPPPPPPASPSWPPTEQPTGSPSRPPSSPPTPTPPPDGPPCLIEIAALDVCLQLPNISISLPDLDLGGLPL